MMYAPHILQVLSVTPEQRDEYGRPVAGSGSQNWCCVCECRCDDNTTKEFKSENGKVYRPQYHIVSSRIVEAGVKAGDRVRCLTCGGETRGEGIVYKVVHHNFFNYSEVWV